MLMRKVVTSEINYRIISGQTLATLSPNQEYLASVVGTRVHVWLLKQKTTEEKEKSPAADHILFQCLDKVDKLEFSPNSEYICCSQYARLVVQIFSVLENNWKCRINESSAGLINTIWLPDSHGILTESDFGIQLSIWSFIEDTKQAIISLPKGRQKPFKNQIYCFHDFEPLLLVLHRMELQDMIGVYSYDPINHSHFTELHKFKSRSVDVCAVQFMDHDNHIITFDTPLNYRCNIYTPVGELLYSLDAYQNALGIRSFHTFNALRFVDESMTTTISTISKSSWIAVGSYDGRIRLISTSTWQLAFVLPLSHPKDMEAGLVPTDFATEVEVLAKDQLHHHGGEDFTGPSNKSVLLANALMQGTLTKEESTRNFNMNASMNSIMNNSQASNMSDLASGTTNYLATVYIHRMMKALPKLSMSDQLAATSSAAQNAANKSALTLNNSLPNMGVNYVEFSPDGNYLAATEESSPRCLWIWNPSQAKLVSLLVQLDHVLCATWRPRITSVSPGEEINPDTQVLAFVTGNTNVYLWTSSMGTKKIDNVFSSINSNVNVTATTSSTKSNVNISSVGASTNAGSVVGFPITIAKWSKDGRKLLLKNRDHSTILDLYIIV